MGVANGRFELGARGAHVTQAHQGRWAGQVEREAEHTHTGQRLKRCGCGGCWAVFWGQSSWSGRGRYGVGEAKAR